MLGHRFALGFGVFALLLIAFPASSQAAAGLDQYNLLGTTSGLTHSANPVDQWSTVGREGLLAKDGEWQWAKRAGGRDYDVGAAITTLSDNSVVVIGTFSGLATFGPGEPNETVLVSDGSGDIFVSKHNPDGTIAWAKRAGGTSYDVGAAITPLSDNSIIVTGSFSGSATFGPGEPSETLLVSDGSGDIFLAKYYPDGTIAWAKRAGGTDYDVGTAITTLSDNSVVVTGSFSGSATWGRGESAETLLVSDGSDDIFLVRHLPDGTIAWGKRAGGTDYDVGAAITTLSDNSIVVTGSFSGSATWGRGESAETLLVSDGSGDIFVVRHLPDGTIAWGKRAGGTSSDVGAAITTLSDNSILVTGSFSGSATWGPGESAETELVSDGSNDIFVAKHNPDGMITWGKRAGGTDNDVGAAITPLSDNSMIVTGSFSGSATWGLGETAETVLVSDGSGDIFVAKYDPNGNFAWAKRAGGTDDDFGNGVSVDGNGNTYITGSFNATADFGSYILTSEGSYDVFVAKLSEPIFTDGFESGHTNAWSASVP